MVIPQVNTLSIKKINVFMNYLMNNYLEFFIRKYVQNNVWYGEKSKIDNYIHSINQS